MDGKDIGHLMASSADAVYDYVTCMQFAVDPPMGVSITRVSSCDVHETYAVLHLESDLGEQSSPILMVDDVTYPDSIACFQRYDEMTRTVVIRPPEHVLRTLAVGTSRIRIVSDMRFLISSVREFYERYGDMVSIPDRVPATGPPVFPDGVEPTDEQRRAVDTVLSSPLCYIWGAPGTGKTQFVLATCIRTILESGRKVAVFAPTNNSVEQVLDGLIEAMGDERPRMVRLGIPSKSFLSRHPGLCEDRHAQNRLKRCREEISHLEEVLLERSADLLYQEIDGLVDRLGSSDTSEPSGLLDVLRPYMHLIDATQLDELMGSRDPFELCRKLKFFMDARERPVKDIVEYSEWKDSDIVSEIVERRREESSLRVHDPEVMISNASVIAGTPLQFVSRFRPKGSEEDGRTELDVDHIFLDEAGYSNLPQAMSLFTNGVPVTMLGDHMQLPPVCEMDDELLRDGAMRGRSLRDAYLWGMSAIHAGSMFGNDEDGMRRVFLDSVEPSFDRMVRSDLTASRRFGTNLAEVLDRFVYRNGLKGMDGRDLEILVVDCVCDERKERENTVEADAIRSYLRGWSPDVGDVAVLTPYNGQVRLLRRVLPRRFRDSVMTVHGSQGREWDTVLLSVADGRVDSRDVPLRFTSSHTDIGCRLMNTAVSRAKRRLVVFCDVEFWMKTDDELLKGLVESGRIVKGSPGVPGEMGSSHP